MTMTNPSNPIAAITLSPREASLAVELFAERVRKTKAPLASHEMLSRLASCYDVIIEHRNVLARIETYKKVMGLKKLGKEGILTAINDGHFPSTAEQFDKAEKYYNRFFETRYDKEGRVVKNSPTPKTSTETTTATE